MFPSGDMKQVKVHLYGKLRRYANHSDPRGDSILTMDGDGKTIEQIIIHMGIERCELGSNIFVNGEHSSTNRVLKNGDRLALFPDDMQILYKWYFPLSK